ncbi:metal ABC transporter ATP-binding protein [Caproiciproducens faecalis]|uniref:metal ABC transporter ATP-binding protein n=1 Tax=Caproiciproducens faecalis TaxID=2820301 RepID=UPI0038B319D6
MEIQDLYFSYNRENVLSQINLSVEYGDYAGIIGSNGAGKSTLLKLILGVLKPSSGTIRLFGKDGCDPRDFRKIGYIPQNSAAFFGGFPATVEEVVKANLYSQLGFLRLPAKKHKVLVQQALETVGMQDCAKRRIGELSGGQQQRIMLARVLVAQPQILLLDEPVTGIDAQAAKSLYALLEQLNAEQGITILMVTHDVERAFRSAKHILHLNSSGVLEEDHDI